MKDSKKKLTAAARSLSSSLSQSLLAPGPLRVRAASLDKTALLSNMRNRIRSHRAFLIRQFGPEASQGLRP